MKKRHVFNLLLLTALLTSCTFVPSSSSSASSFDSEISSSESSSSSQSSSEIPSSSQPSTSEPSSEPSSSSSSSQDSSEPDLPPISYVQVFCPVDYIYIYAWQNTNNGVKELVGKWPGTQLKQYDDEWKTYDFQSETALNLIFNKGNGQEQTRDLSVTEAGYYWYYNNDLHPNKPGEGDNDTPSSAEPVQCDSWQNFSYWDSLPSSYWTTVNKYNGDRKDFRNESIYFTITTRFYDGDMSNNVKCWDGRNNASNDPAWRGDFKGLIDKMDYIKALGFTAIWITPVVRNASGYDYHGYHALNLDEVDERYLSTDVDFQDVINEAHKRDMKIVLDVVFNHTGNFGEENIFPMFYKEGDLSSVNCLKMHEDSPLPSSYFSMDGNRQYDERIAAMKNTRNDGSDPNYIYHHYGNFSWETFGEQVAQIAGDCVDLNTENPIVAEYITRCYGDFIRMGVDAFRIDTMKHVSRLTLNNYIFPALYEIARRCGNTNFYMFGEVCTRVREVWNRNIPALSAPFYTRKEEKSYPWGDVNTNLASIEQAYNDNSTVQNERTSQNAHLSSGLKYHTPDYSQSNGVGVIDFPMHWNFRYASDAFNLAKNTDQYYNDATYNVMYVDSHDYGPDTISEVRYNMGTQAWAENLNLMFTFRGIPCLYYGSEIEFQKGKRIDQGPNIALADSGRAYYGNHLEGSVTATDFGSYTASGNVKTTLQSVLAKHLIKLNKIRQAIPALSMGQYTTNGVNGNMAFIRRYTQGDIDSLALVAISSNATFTNIPNGAYVDVVTGDKINVSNGTLSTQSLSQGNLRVYVLKNSYTGNLTKIGESTAYLK